MINPLVSIIIPVYNGANYMKEAIESALAQTYKNIEIIVVNDGSDDNEQTEKIALQYENRIKYFRKENGGSSSALNYGIQKMQGQYFSWLSHDDVYMPDKIEKQIKALEICEDPNMVVVCDSLLIDCNGKKILGKKNNIKGIREPKEIFSFLIHGHSINGCTVLVSKQIIEKVGLFDEQMVYLNDLDYWYRIMFNGASFLYIENQLVKCRIHNQQVSVKKKNLLDVEKHYLVQKSFEFLRQKQERGMFFVKQLLVFCAHENLLREKDEMIKWLEQKGKISRVEKNKLIVEFIKGQIINVLKTIRRKIMFRR